MIDKTNVFLCLFLATLLLIIFYIPSPRQQTETSTSKAAESHAAKELLRFQVTVKKFVKSMGDMQQRLDELEDKVQHIQKKQESFHLLQKRDNNIPEQQAVNHNAVRPNSNLEQHKKEVEFAGFIGEIKRDNYCLDSAEHDIHGTIEIWECHKKGRNQEFIVEDGNIRHKAWCLAIAKPEEGERVVLKECNDKYAILEWSYHDRTLKAGNTNFCMVKKPNTDTVTVALCNAKDTAQQWELEQSYEP